MKTIQNTSSRFLVASALVLTVLFGTLSTTFADRNNGENDDNNRKERNSESEENRINLNQSVFIFNSNHVEINGAKITGINGNTINVVSTWGSTSLPITLNSSSTTKFYWKGGAQAMLSDLVVGDMLKVSGSLNTTNGGLTVDAKSIRDLSRQRVPEVNLDRHVFEGRLQSVSSTTLPTTITLLINNINYTVNLAVNTVILAKNWATIGLNTLVVGDTVRVFGSILNATSTTINASVLRDATR